MPDGMWHHQQLQLPAPAARTSPWTADRGGKGSFSVGAVQQSVVDGWNADPSIGWETSPFWTPGGVSNFVSCCLQYSACSSPPVCRQLLPPMRTPREFGSLAHAAKRMRHSVITISAEGTRLAQNLGQLEAVNRGLQSKSLANLQLLGQLCNFRA